MKISHPDSWLEEKILAHLAPFKRHAYVPYTKNPVVAAVILHSGAWIPGVRVENAAFPVLIPAFLNALTTAVTLGYRKQIQAFVLTRPFWPEERTVLESFFAREMEQPHPQLLLLHPPAPLPDLTPQPVSPFLPHTLRGSPEEGIRLARKVAEKAWIPESRFPVGCVIETAGGKLIPGANVEHRDWTRGLCAERNALGTALTYGYRELRHVYLSCTKFPGCTPCGACRQVLVELIPETTLYLDAEVGPQTTRAKELLPAFFSGKALR